MRWVATRLHGDGTETVVADEVPVAQGVVQRALTGAGSVSGRVDVEVARLQGTREAAETAMLATSGKTRLDYGNSEPPGDPDVLWLQGPARIPHVWMADEWHPADSPQLVAAARIEHERILIPGTTGLYCLTDHGVVLGGGILGAGSVRQGPTFRLQARGHAGFLNGLPYDGQNQWIQEDPANLIRHAWNYVQSLPRHDLGVVLDSTTTPVRIGEEEEDVEFTTGAGEEVAFTAGPFKWNYWQTHDLGREVDSLAVDTPIEYLMEHTWKRAEATVSHVLRLGYPRLGRRRDDLSFVVGVNVMEEPPVTAGGEVSRVLVVGAGEGSEARRGMAERSVTALGGTVTLTDKALTSNAACRQAAQRHLEWLTGTDELTTVRVIDHPNAPLGTWQPGDDIRVQGSGKGWGGDLDMWVRVLSDDLHPEEGRATLTVTRAERVG